MATRKEWQDYLEKQTPAHLEKLIDAIDTLKKGGKEMSMKELDRQALRALVPLCPQCGATLYPVIVDGAPIGFDCLDCETFHSFDNIASS